MQKLAILFSAPLLLPFVALSAQRPADAPDATEPAEAE